MKRLIVALTVAVTAASGAVAQDKEQFFGVANHWGLSVGFGTTGIAIDASTMVTPYLGLRGGLDLMPDFKYTTDLDLSIPGEAQQTWNQLRQGAIPGVSLALPELPSSVEVEGKPKFSGGHLLLDVYPFKTSFHLTAGAYVGSEDIISVYNTSGQDLLSAIYQYNRLTEDATAAAAMRAAGLQPSKIGVELGDYFLEPDAQGKVDASIRVNSFRPYLGLGFGRAVPKKRVGCQFDLGVQLWGSPGVYLRDKKLNDSDLDGEDGGVIKYASKVSMYPVMSFRLVGRLF